MKQIVQKSKFLLIVFSTIFCSSLIGMRSGQARETLSYKWLSEEELEVRSEENVRAYAKSFAPIFPIAGLKAKFLAHRDYDTSFCEQYGSEEMAIKVAWAGRARGCLRFSRLYQTLTRAAASFSKSVLQELVAQYLPACSILKWVRVQFFQIDLLSYKF